MLQKVELLYLICFCWWVQEGTDVLAVDMDVVALHTEGDREHKWMVVIEREPSTFIQHIQAWKVAHQHVLDVLLICFVGIDDLGLAKRI